MRIFKTMLLSVFIGFYFLSITPMHFYAHVLDQQEATSHAYDDCTYVNLLNYGQGNFLNPEIIDFSTIKFLEFNSIDEIELNSSIISNYLSFHFNLRAPPALNC